MPERNIPAAPIMLLMRAWQWLHFKLGIPAPSFTPHELNKLTISNVIHSDAAIRDFNYSRIKSVADGMRESVAYYLELDRG